MQCFQLFLRWFPPGYQTPESHILSPIFNEIEKTDDPTNIDNRVNMAITKFRRYNATLDEKKDAVRILGTFTLTKQTVNHRDFLNIRRLLL